MIEYCCYGAYADVGNSAECPTRKERNMNNPWEKDRDCDGRWMVCSGPETVICRGIRREADADLIVALHMVLDDMDTCVAERGLDYQFQELSEETLAAISAARSATKEGT